MSSYYNEKEILNMFPLNFDKMDPEEQVKVIQEIALTCDISVDKVLEAMNYNN